VNQGLAGIERIAVSVAKNASEGIDGMTASPPRRVKRSLAGNLLTEAIRGAAEWVTEYSATRTTASGSSNSSAEQ